MIYVLYSATGLYEDYRETAEYYFTNKHDAEKVYMTEEVAIKVCELLNSGAYSLEG